MAAPDGCWCERVDREQRATTNHLLWLHPEAESILPRRNLRDSQQTTSELLHGFYRMPVSVKGSPRLKRYVIRGLHKLADPSTSYGSTTTTRTVTSKPLRSRSVGSVSTKGSRSHGSVANMEDETRSRASHHTSLRSRANSVNSVVSRSLTSIRGTSDAAAHSIAHSEVRELVHAQVCELLKPLKKEIALSRQARIAAEEKVNGMKKAWISSVCNL